MLVGHYLPKQGGRAVAWLRLLIFSAGLALVGRFINLDAVMAMVALAAIVWCGTALRETYLLTLDDPHLEPRTDQPAAASSAPQIDATETTNKRAPSAATTAALPKAVDKRLGGHVESQSQRSPPPGQAALGALLSKQRLSRRPPLGKKSVRSLR